MRTTEWYVLFQRYLRTTEPKMRFDSGSQDFLAELININWALPGPRSSEEPGVIEHQPLGVDW